MIFYQKASESVKSGKNVKHRAEEGANKTDKHRFSVIYV